MCPDSQILSVYFDKELPSPWKEKMEQHLSACPGCMAKLAGYGALSRTLNPAAAAGDLRNVSPDEVKDRIWENINRRNRKAEQPPVLSFKPRRPSFAIPLPAAVAAMLLAAFIGAVLSVQMRGSSVREDIIAIGPDPLGVIPVADMGDVFRYLEQQETAGDIVIIKLPESRNFKSTGEPVLMRAADYNRGNFPR